MSKKNKPTIEKSIYDCTFIEQKISEWRKMLEKAKSDPSIKRKQLISIQNKLSDMCNIVLRDRYPDIGRPPKGYPEELVSKLYYSYYRNNYKNKRSL